MILFYQLHKDLGFLEQRPEIPRRIAPLGLEYTVEIGQVVEAATVADFGDILRSIHQQTGGIS